MDIDRIAEQSREFESLLGEPLVCFDISGWVVREWDGIRFVEGEYEGPDIDDSNVLPEYLGCPYEHSWNVLSDGTILDGSAQQFGQDPVRLIPPGDPRQAWYREGRDLTANAKRFANS